ncbi:MAG: hypothetical protein CL760_01065 [Chloroflexi bacterium]|nr:hypothetical protein [Chloroflexota bacterium]|tara:strand:+ start:10001 stop:10747 length:747 start_codon:yes stop_codon:yes gene_type:complete
MTIKYNPKKYNKLKLIDSNISYHKSNFVVIVFCDLSLIIFNILIYLFAAIIASFLIFEQTFSFLIEDYFYINVPAASALVFGSFIAIKALFHLRNSIDKILNKMTKIDFADDCFKIIVVFSIIYLSVFILFEKELLYGFFDNITIRFLFILSIPFILIEVGKIIFIDIKNIFTRRSNDIKRIKRISTEKNNIVKNIIHTENIQNILAESTPKEARYYEKLFKKNFKEVIYFKKENQRRKEKESILENL